MKKIGIVGGLGPESTTEYYKGIISKFRQSTDEPVYPEILLYSLNMYQFLGMVEARQWNEIAGLLLSSVDSLYRAGAEFAAIASNTPHIMFDAVQSKSPIPMISIVEATRARAVGMALKRIGLMGTKFTMQSDFYQKAFLQKDLPIIVPKPEEQQEIHDKLMNEIELGIIMGSTRERFLEIIRRMMNEDSIDALVLGCTELPLILDKDEYGIPFLDTTSIHVDSIVHYCREG
ncbi:aspartate/glutamate racemase family protein [Chloroflexota bacterium]